MCQSRFFFDLRNLWEMDDGQSTFSAWKAPFMT